jgi:protein involved in polysaccharide export with SLBB domain
MRRNSSLRVVLALAIALGVCDAALAQEAPAVPQTTPAVPQTAPAVATISVRVVGEVKKPGTFAVPVGSRVSDVLGLAGLHPFAELPKNVRLVDALPLMGTCVGDADLQRVLLRRQSGDAPAIHYMFDFLKSRNDARYDPVLRDNDALFVPVCMRFKPIQISAAR